VVGTLGEGGEDALVWLQLSLVFKGKQVSVVIDGKQVASMSDGTYSGGMAAIGSGWHKAVFDNFTATNSTVQE
jgi:hypothetical protein